MRSVIGFWLSLLRSSLLEFWWLAVTRVSASGRFMRHEGPASALPLLAVSDGLYSRKSRVGRVEESGLPDVLLLSDGRPFWSSSWDRSPLSMASRFSAFSTTSKKSFFWCSVQAPRNRAAWNAPENAAAWLHPFDCRTGHSDRLQLQPRWHEHLHDNCSGIPGPGDEHSPGSWATACSSGRRDAFIQRRHRRHRRRFHYAGSDTLGAPICSDRLTGYPRRHRSIHE